MLKIPLESISFPGTVGSLPREVAFSKTKLLWSCITVGRPDKSSVKHFEQFARFEMLYRWNMIQASMDFSSTSNLIHNSPAFRNFDPSEKGSVNFFLGMVILKLCADLVLDTPWLVHASLFKTKGGSLPLVAGKSCADLLGFSNSYGGWGVFEAKGRNSGVDTKLIEKAKDQATNIASVNGARPWIYVASTLYRIGSNKQLGFYWEDPNPPDGKPTIHLEGDRDTWWQYYLPIRELVREYDRDPSSFEQQFGFRIELNKQVHELVSELDNNNPKFELALERLQTWSRDARDKQDDFWQGDGV